MKVSIQIPVYNGAGFLSEALESIRRQTYQDYEIIVVDDGSEEMYKKEWSFAPDIMYCRQEHRGVAAARNHALQLSSGEVIAFLDADDLWEPDKLEKQMRYLQEHPECEVIFCGVQNFTQIPEQNLTERQNCLLQTKISNCLVGSCIRKRVFERYGGYQENLNYGEDTELLARLGAAGVRLDHCLEENLYLRRVHGENMSLLHEKVGRQEYLELLAEAFRRGRKK